MRRRKAKSPVIRLPRKRYDVTKLPRVYVPYLDDRPGVLAERGPEQSLIHFLDDRSDEFLPREICMPNRDWKWGRPPRRRVKLKPKRVRLK